MYRRFLPERVRVLVVSESPPPGLKQDYLYNLQSRDRLRKVLARILGLDRDDLVVKLLRERGVFWTTAIKCRPWSRRDIPRMRLNCLHVLKLEIELLRPEKIVAAGTTAWRSIEDLRVYVQVPVIKVYHPLYIARFRPDTAAELVRALEVS